MARNRNKIRSLVKSETNSCQGRADCENEYDLEKNIKRINSYSKNRRYKYRNNSRITDSRKIDEPLSNSNGIVESINANSAPVRTGDSSTWDSFVRLDDKITDFNYKNDQAHTNLRRELEDKIKQSEMSLNDSIKECRDAISKRLHIQWYIWTITGLVTIVGIWYMLSYINVHPLPAKVIDIEKRLNAIESEIGSSTHDTINTRMEIRH